jgi:hypothetical protein
MEMTGVPHQECKERTFLWQGKVGPFQSVQHTFAIFLGVAGIVCFSIALVQQRPFDATLAAVLIMLCWYIFYLHTAREKLKARQVCGSPQDSVAGRTGHATSVDADGMSELDLTGYAKTLGVSISSGTGLEEGGTLSKILLDALAKEYLRCMSALKCYQQAFGAMPEDIESNQAAIASLAMPIHLPLDTVAGTESSTAQTPRSPMANPPSPDPKRCRQHLEAQSSTAHHISETQAADEGRSAAQEPQSQSQPNAASEDQEEPVEPCSFGLFGKY